jgi:hypothetical protein
MNIKRGCDVKFQWTHLETTFKWKTFCPSCFSKRAEVILKHSYYYVCGLRLLRTRVHWKVPTTAYRSQRSIEDGVPSSHLTSDVFFFGQYSCRQTIYAYRQTCQKTHRQFQHYRITPQAAHGPAENSVCMFIPESNNEFNFDSCWLVC